MQAWRTISAVVLLIGLTCLSGCASRPDSGALLSNTTPSVGATAHDILVATTRARDERPGTYFNGERSGALNFATMTVSVPPTHKSGNVEWPSSNVGNPQTDFVTRDGGFLSGEREFLEQLNDRLRKQPKGQRKVLLFVHGYNTLFAEGLYRFTQIAHDARASGVPVFFSWASRGRTVDYVYDNNSVSLARDGLEKTLRLLGASDADEINVLAHSMGTWLTVETFRQVKISGIPIAPRKIGTVILAAPDIDVDVFKSEMQRIGKPRKPFLIVLSRDDRALGMSKLIAGGKERLGATGNIEELTALGAVVVDLSEVDASDSARHGKFAQIAEVGPDAIKVLAQGIPAHEPNDPAGVMTKILTLPAAAVSAPVRVISAN